jgi:hypothetical protein
MKKIKFLIILSLSIICLINSVIGSIKTEKENQFFVNSFNEKPIPDFEWTPKWPNTSTIIHFNASKSYDPDGYISMYSWDFTNDGVADKTGMEVTWLFDSEGIYPVRLSICDDLLLCNGTTKEIRVLEHTPVAEFKFSPQNPIINQIVTMDASDSFDNDGFIMTYYWDYDGDPDWDVVGGEEDKIVSYSWDNIGTYIVTLKVFDNTSHYDIINKSITITENNPPFIPYDPNPEDGAQNISTEVVLSWDGGDPDGDIVKYDVYFGSIPPIQKVSSNQSNTNYDPGLLSDDLTYFWNIVAWDSKDAKSNSPSWHFTTSSEEDNIPPNVMITNPTNGLYLFNNKITELIGNIVAIGPIEITANISDDESGIDYVEIHLNKSNADTTTVIEGETNFSFIFGTFSIGKWSVKIIAYDNAENMAYDEIEIFKIF